MTQIKPKLCKAGQRLREQIDDAFSSRSRVSDGWIGDTRHAARTSQHNPDPATGWVRALDIDSDLRDHKSAAYDLADQLRLLARRDKRISYIIFDGKIASYKRNYKWRRYTGLNPHRSHLHVSFTPQGDNDDRMFRIPILTGEAIDGASKSTRRKLGKILPSRSTSNLPSGGMGATGCPKCRCRCGASGDSTVAQP